MDENNGNTATLLVHNIKELEIKLDAESYENIKRLLVLERQSEIDALRASNAELREALEKASKLLEALRMDSGVGNILGSPEKEIYASIEMEINNILAKQEGK